MKWKKLGQIFNPQSWNDGVERDWMFSHSQCASALVFDNFIRVYFSCRPKNDEEGQATSYTAFLDIDKKDLSKVLRVSKSPVLPLGELGTFDEHAVYPTSTIRHEGKTLLYYAGWSRCKSVPFNTSIGLATSNDGESFKRLGLGPILSHSVDEPFVVSGPKVRKFNKKWYMYYLAGNKWIANKEKAEIVYKIRMATSIDGINWEKENKNLINNLLEDTECQAGPDVFFYDGKYHMYFVYRSALNFRNNKNNAYRIGYAFSKDLFNWTRDDDNVGITFSKEGWDSQMLHYPHIFRLDNIFYMLYNGNEFGKYGLGLARLEND
jgi:predicted GH43/DUF377 family glycosyl hydrolase